MKPWGFCSALSVAMVSFSAMSGACAAASENAHLVRVNKLDGKLQVVVDGQMFAEYRYEGSPNPVIYPILGPHGVPMTRSFPIETGVAGEAKDHPHHRSMWFTHGSVNGIDFWSKNPGAGTIVQRGAAEIAEGPGYATIVTHNGWVGPEGQEVCSDEREITFRAHADARMIDWKVTIHASQRELVFGDTKEGTMGIRMHPNLRLKNDPQQGVTTAAGRAVNSSGISDQAVWGKRARWVDYHGPIEGHTVGIAIFDHPTNPRHPTWWHAREYGLVAANPFGVHDFENKPAGTGDMKISANERVTFRYRFVFHEGDAKEANIDQLYEDYATGGLENGLGRVLPIGELPHDSRLGPLKDLDGYFPLAVPATVEACQTRAAKIRRRILVANGLWPMPAKGPIRATVHGLVDRADYTVEKVFLESYPGHFVTGSLYRPKNRKGPHAAVLSPHGHWPNGRFHDHGRNVIRDQIIAGGERFETSGRHPLQARCAQLARMGCIVFHYDMEGYADSQQLSLALVHRHSEPRLDFDTPENWGFFGAQATLRLQSVMGLQTYNSIRALDWICSLPEVDSSRIGVTGASGGGTQTMILAAIDPRVAVSVPAVMVSTAMQGGCTCENASCLRVGTGNVEFAGLFAPKPLCITAADDWTHELATKGLPELRQLYQLLGSPDNVMAATRVEFKHNYNYVNRAVMYDWMNKHLGLGLDTPVVEEDFEPLSIEEMSVWNDQHPMPTGGAEHERALLQAMTKASDQKIAELMPRDAASWQKYREVVGGAFETLVGRGLPTAGSIARVRIEKHDRGEFFEFRDLVQYSAQGEELPVVMLHPKDGVGEVVLWIDGRGKQALYTPAGTPQPQILRLLKAGRSVVGVDLVYQGEFLPDGQPPRQARKVENPRDFAGYTLGYNPALFAQRVHDILTLISFVIHDQHAAGQVHLVGVQGAGPWAAVARAIAGDQVQRAAIDTGGFRFQSLTSWRDVNLLPGAVKYGDLPALLALSAPHRLWIAGEGNEMPGIVAAAYQFAGGGAPEMSVLDDPHRIEEELVTWLLK